MSHTSAAPLRTTYWVFQIGSKCPMWRDIVPFAHLTREGRMTVTIGRRELLVALSGAAAAWPLAARAQQAAIPVVGYLHAASSEAAELSRAALRQGLSETGYVEGRNVAIEFRPANNDNNRLPELAADLVRRRVAVIVTGGGAVSAKAAKAATATIPIVFSAGEDPIAVGS